MQQSLFDFVQLKKRVILSGSFTPNAESAQVITPIVATAGRILIVSSANVTPTASASMLVATASGSMAAGVIALLTPSASPKASRIMFAPISPSRTKAIQWSTAVIFSANVAPRKKPRSGISA